jgi:hypothetical protein
MMSDSSPFPSSAASLPRIANLPPSAGGTNQNASGGYGSTQGTNPINSSRGSGFVGAASSEIANPLLTASLAVLQRPIHPDVATRQRPCARALGPLLVATLLLMVSLVTACSFGR